MIECEIAVYSYIFQSVLKWCTGLYVFAISVFFSMDLDERQSNGVHKSVLRQKEKLISIFGRSFKERDTVYDRKLRKRQRERDNKETERQCRNQYFRSVHSK